MVLILHRGLVGAVRWGGRTTVFKGTNFSVAVGHIIVTAGELLNGADCVCPYRDRGASTLPLGMSTPLHAPPSAQYHFFGIVFGSDKADIWGVGGGYGAAVGGVRPAWGTVGRGRRIPSH